MNTGWNNKRPRPASRHTAEERREWRQEFDAWFLRNRRRLHRTPITQEQRDVIIGEDVRSKAKTCFSADTRTLKLIMQAAKGTI